MTDGQNGAEVIETLAVKELILGVYTAAIATDSTGYILVKSSDGVARKLMVQA